MLVLCIYSGRGYDSPFSDALNITTTKYQVLPARCLELQNL